MTEPPTQPSDGALTADPAHFDEPTVFDIAETRLRLEPDERKELILAAAQRVFAQQPYDSVSLNQIADLAGTTRTNIYYYFRTKRNLFLEVVYRFSRIP